MSKAKIDWANIDESDNSSDEDAKLEIENHIKESPAPGLDKQLSHPPKLETTTTNIQQKEEAPAPVMDRQTSYRGEGQGGRKYNQFDLEKFKSQQLAKLEQIESYDVWIYIGRTTFKDLQNQVKSLPCKKLFENDKGWELKVSREDAKRYITQGIGLKGFTKVQIGNRNMPRNDRGDRGERPNRDYNNNYKGGRGKYVQKNNEQGETAENKEQGEPGSTGELPAQNVSTKVSEFEFKKSKRPPKAQEQDRKQPTNEGQRTQETNEADTSSKNDRWSNKNSNYNNNKWGDRERKPRDHDHHGGNREMRSPRERKFNDYGLGEFRNKNKKPEDVAFEKKPSGTEADMPNTPGLKKFTSTPAPQQRKYKEKQQNPSSRTELPSATQVDQKMQSAPGQEVKTAIVAEKQKAVQQKQEPSKSTEELEGKQETSDAVPSSPKKKKSNKPKEGSKAPAKKSNNPFDALS